MSFDFDVKTFLLLALIFSPLEYLFAERKEQKIIRSGWLTDVLHFFVNAIFIRAGLFAVVLTSVKIGAAIMPAFATQTLAAMPLWLQVIAVIVVADFGIYVSHWLMHHVPFLWNFHAVHHSTEEMDWLAAYRVHPVDQVLVKGTSLVPIFVLGFSEAAIAIASVLYFWHSVLLHSNVKINLGPLKWLVASPEFHHWHHANQSEAVNKNFSGQLPLWDIIFRTAHMPGPLPEKYGVDDPVPRDYPRQLAYPFVCLWRTFVRPAQSPAPPANSEAAHISS